MKTMAGEIIPRIRLLVKFIWSGGDVVKLAVVVALVRGVLAAGGREWRLAVTVAPVIQVWVGLV